MSYLHGMALRIWSSFWRREGSAGMDMWNAPMVKTHLWQTRLPLTYRFMESVGKKNNELILLLLNQELLKWSLVAMTELKKKKKKCITSAYLQCPFHSGEQAMSLGPLVLLSVSIYIIICSYGHAGQVFLGTNQNKAMWIKCLAQGYNTWCSGGSWSPVWCFATSPQVSLWN